MACLTLIAKLIEGDSNKKVYKEINLIPMLESISHMEENSSDIRPLCAYILKNLKFPI